MSSDLVVAAASEPGVAAQPPPAMYGVILVVALLVGALWLWERGTRSARGFASTMQLRAVLGRSALRRGARELRPGLHPKRGGKA
jgi:hypothetical protein